MAKQVRQVRQVVCLSVCLSAVMALMHFPSLPVMTARLHTVAPGTLLPAPQAKSIAAPPAMARMKCQATLEAQMGAGGEATEPQEPRGGLLIPRFLASGSP